jgi:hypothetical protein
MAGIPADRAQYRLMRRHRSKNGGKPLKGFALDLTIRFNSNGTVFVQDINGDATMPFASMEQARDFIVSWLEWHYRDHFAGTSAASAGR